MILLFTETHGKQKKIAKKKKKGKTTMKTVTAQEKRK